MKKYLLVPVAAILFFVFASTVVADSFVYSNNVFNRVTVPDFPNVDVGVQGINNAGEIVGSLHGIEGFVQSNGVTTLLNDPTSADTQAFGISNNGVIVGVGSNPHQTHGFIYNNGTYTTLDYPGLGNDAGGTLLEGINNSGQIVGVFGDDTTPSKSLWFLYSGGNFTPIIPPGSPDFMFGIHINDLGQIAGTYTVNGAGYSGFVDTNGVFQIINAPGTTGTVVQGINDLGQVVGSYWDSHGVLHGFLDTNGTFTTIDAPGAVQSLSGTYLTGINDQGQIVGNSPGYFVPSPEPPSIALIVCGLLGVALICRRSPSVCRRG